MSCARFNTACLIVITIAIALFLWRLDARLTQTSSAITSVAQGLSNTIQKVNLAADQDTKYYAQAAQQLPKTEREIRDLLVHTDKNLNDPISGTIPKMNHAMMALTLDIHDTLRAGEQTLAAADATLDASTHTMDLLNTRLADPQLGELLGRLDVTALHIEGIAGNSEKMSQDMQIAVHRLAQPPTKWHQFLDASWTAAKFGSLFVP